MTFHGSLVWFARFQAHSLIVALTNLSLYMAQIQPFILETEYSSEEEL